MTPRSKLLGGWWIWKITGQTEMLCQCLKPIFQVWKKTAHIFFNRMIKWLRSYDIWHRALFIYCYLEGKVLLSVNPSSPFTKLKTKLVTVVFACPFMFFIYKYLFFVSLYFKKKTTYFTFTKVDFLVKTETVTFTESSFTEPHLCSTMVWRPVTGSIPWLATYTKDLKMVPVD